MLCGIDEAGRGPLAGPVSAAAVILPDGFDVSLLDDSKKMSEKKREVALGAIMDGAVSWCVGWASNEEIDQLNILRATLLAMARAFEGMVAKLPSSDIAQSSIDVIVDGLFCPDIVASSLRAAPKADATYPAVMAASILAKQARDRAMIRYSWLYPEYGYERHKGYPTSAHVSALKENGPSPIQRRTFRLKGEGQLRFF